ncbi:MAG: glycosyltransferase family 2 protein [Patescibacteria group bacterium]|jgi:glycosyltransferase involved in cell wall biosynthesis|nr:glycosyltransferase family 2 protein [bacterium]
MKFSLITPTYNSAATISRTIVSVIAQEFSDLEYIIIDGGSKDNTLDIIKSYQSKINIKLVSEPDNGIYNAMNKGIKLASGEVVGILNSDDLFFDNSILNLVSESFFDNKIDIVYGDIEYFSSDIDKTNRYWKTGEYRERKLNNGWTIPHPALFIRRRVYDQAGLYREDFRVAADYEFILRILKKHRFDLKYIPRVLVKMYSGGTSGRDLRQRKRGWQELKKAWLVNDFKPPFLFIFRRIILKIKQFV